MTTKGYRSLDSSFPFTAASVNQAPKSISRRGIVAMLAAAAGLATPQIASAMCVGKSEEGRWRNLDRNGDPAFIDVRMIDCGDQVLNGQQTSTRYSLKVWVRQSTGQCYGRPNVKATYRPWNGNQWLYGKVPTGGYQDHLWMRAVTRDGTPQLHVLIKHESLDSKPSSTSEYWFSR